MTGFKAHLSYKESGVEWLGKIPIDWKLIKLRYVCDINTGNKDTQDSVPEGEYSFFVRSDVVEKINKYTHNEEAVLTAGDGVGVGRVFHYFKGKFAAHQRVYIFTNFKNVSAKFIYYYLKSNLAFEVLKSNAKSTVDSLRKPMLSNFIVSLPSMDEQEKIVVFLDQKIVQIDAILEKKKQQIQSLQQYRQSLITETVTRGLNPNMDMKDSDLEWVDKIPAHWNVKKIKFLFDYIDERNKNPNATLLSLFTEIGVKPRSEMEEKGNKAQTVIDYKKVKEGDIIVNKLLAWMGAIARSDYKGVCSPDYDVYRGRKGIVDSNYYHYYFRSLNFKGDCYKYGRGIMMMRWRTYPDQFKSIPVIIPPIKEQVEIANYLNEKCEEIDQTIKDINALIEKIKDYRQSLIYEAVTGKIDVRNYTESELEVKM